MGIPPVGGSDTDAGRALDADTRVLEQFVGVAPSGMRRLTRVEYDNSLRDLLGDRSRSGFAKLPEDANDPFDNDYTTQQVSGGLIDSLETLANEAAARALGDPARRQALVACVPSGPGDEACLRQFLARFLRRAFRRPVRDDDVERYVALRSLAVEAGDFFYGVELAIRAALQDPEFVYRIEIGTNVAGSPSLYRLNPFEVATRMAYFILGTTPPDALLDLAEQNKLESSAERRVAARMLLSDPRARDRVDYFHALWLGYHALPHPPDLTVAMRSESAALVARVVFEQRGDYFDLFQSAETFVNGTLAEHYGLARPSSPAGSWVSYAGTGRKGILSHGSVLSAGAKFDDTSPTLRGIFIRTRLLCETIPPPPPTVNVDQPPTSSVSRCKTARYESHASVGSCRACHQRTDPVGFGLEAYDRTGAFRTHDKDADECPVSGEGELVGVGTFNGPGGLADLLLRSGNLESCVTTQLYRFAMGRREGEADRSTLDQLTTLFRQRNRAFDELIVDTVASAAFAHRSEE